MLYNSSLVVPGEPAGQRLDADVLRHARRPEERGEELVVEDVLVLGVQDAPGLLVQLLVVPAWIEGLQLSAYGVLCNAEVTS